MSSSRVDSGTSSLPPLSATRAGSTVPTVSGGVTTNAAVLQQLRRSHSQPQPHPQQQGQQHNLQQHVDPEHLLTIQSSSSDLAQGYEEPKDGLRERTAASLATAAQDGLYYPANTHWRSRPFHLSASPSITPRPEEFTTVVVAATAVKTTDKNGAAYGRTSAPLGSSGSSQQSRPSSFDPELQTTDAGTSIMATPNVVAAGSGDREHWGSHLTATGAGPANALQNAAAPGKLAGGNTVAGYRVLLPRSPTPEAAYAACTLRSPHENGALKKSNNTVHSNTNNNDSVPSPTSSLALIASAASASTLSRRSKASTSLSCTRAVPVIGAWIPYTPPGVEPELLRHRDGRCSLAAALESEGAAAGTSSATTTVTTGRQAAYESSPSESEFGLAQFSGALSVRSIPAPPLDSPYDISAPSHSTPPVFSLTPSATVEREKENDDANSDHSSQNVVATTRKARNAEAAEVATPALALVVQEEERSTASGESAAPIAAVTEAPRRVKQRPPTLFATSPLTERNSTIHTSDSAPATTGTAFAAVASATCNGSPFGKPPVLVPSNCANEGTELAAAARHKNESTVDDGCLSGGRTHYPEKAHDTPLRTSPLSLISRAESTKLLLHQQNSAVMTASGFNRNSYGSAPTPIKTTGECVEERMKFERVSSAHYPASPPLTSPSPASAGFLTLIPATTGEYEEEDRGVARVQDAEENYVERHPAQQFSESPPMCSPHPPQQQQQNAPQAHRLQGTAILAVSPSRSTREAPLTTPLNTVARRESNSTANANTQSSSLTSHSVVLRSAHNNNINNGVSGGSALASNDTNFSDMPTASLRYSGGCSHAGSTTATGTTAGARHFTSTNAPSPGSDSFTAAGVGDGRAVSIDTPLHSTVAPPATTTFGKFRGARQPSLVLSPTSTTAATTTARTTAKCTATTTDKVPSATATATTNGAPTSSITPTTPQYHRTDVSSSGNGSVTTFSIPSPGDGPSANTIATANLPFADGSGEIASASVAATADAASVHSALPPPVRTTVRRRAPPPSLFKVRSPTRDNSSRNTTTATPSATLVMGGGDASLSAVTSPKSTDPTSNLQRRSSTSVGSLLSTLPLNAQMSVTIMDTHSASENCGSCAGSPGGFRKLGNTTAMTWNVNVNLVGPMHNPPGGSVSPQRHNGTTNNNSSSNNALVRLSHDGHTLVAGMFRVSRDGCLTVRNMLLLNPTRIDAAANPIGSTGPHGSPLSSDVRRPVQLLHPQRTNGINYFTVNSNGGAAGRLLLPHSGQGPATPNTAGSDWCSPQMYGSGALGCAGFSRAGMGSGQRGNNTGYDTTVSNPNASFTLFSTSMDTPFSPITYSLDSQRLTFPNSSGYHHDRGSALMPPAGPQLLRAAREDNNGNMNNSGIGGSSAFGGGNGTSHNHSSNNEAIPTTIAGNCLSVSNAVGGTQAITSNSVTHSRAGGASNSLYRAQLLRQTSSNCINTMQNSTNAVSPTAVQTTGSAGSMFGSGGFNVPDTASSLLMPYADIPAWKTGNGMLVLGPQASLNLVGSPATHTNANLGGGSGFTTTSTAGMNTLQTAQPHGLTTPQLPPNVVRLRDLEIFSTSVGEGASATVFVAIHKPTGRRLAVKRVDLSPLCLGCTSPYLRSGGGSNGRIRQLMQIVIRELQVLHLTYRSPFVVKVYNAFFLPEEAALDIVMEFMHYGSLDHLAKALQEHARHVRESQQQRSRLLYGEDDATGAPLGASPGEDSDRVLTSPHRNFSGAAALVTSPLERVVSPGVSSAAERTGSNGTAVTVGDRDRDGCTGTAVVAAATAGGSVAHASYLSPKMLNIKRNLDQQQVQLRGRRLGLTDTHTVMSPTTKDALTTTTATVAMDAGNNIGPSNNNDDGDDDSLLMDTISIKSNCGTDDTELDDGSGLMEEPFGVTERLVAVVGEQLLRGVRDMHSRGYIHRDIKPGNVLVNEHGVVKLSDFGLSQRCDDCGTDIKNPAMTYVPPPSTVSTRTNTPMHSPSMSALHLGSNSNNNNGGGGWMNRRRSTPFSPYVPRPLPMNDNCPLHPLCIGTASPEFDSSSEGTLLSSSMTNNVAAQRDGMDVLDAESTSSSGSENTNNQQIISSSSSSDGFGNCSGTDKYMSPERQRGEPYSKPADIWAVGVTLAEFAVGEYPYNVEDIIDEFDRVSRLEKPVDVLQFNEHRAAPLSTVFADFIHLATLPIASQRPTAQELLEHPFFKQWHKPFNLRDYLAARVVVPSNQLKNDYLEKHRNDGHQ